MVQFTIRSDLFLCIVVKCMVLITKLCFIINVKCYVHNTSYVVTCFSIYT